MALVVVSTYHLVLKFPTKARIEKVSGNQTIGRECYFATIKGKPKTKETFIVSSKVRPEQSQQNV